MMDDSSENFLLQIDDEDINVDDITKTAKLNEEKNEKFKRQDQEIKKKRINEKGGYRPVLIRENLLEQESAELKSLMSKLNQIYADQQLSDQDVTVLYILIYLNQRYPNKFLGNLNRIESIDDDCDRRDVHSSKPVLDFLDFKNQRFVDRLTKSGTRTFFHLVNNFNLHCVPHSARVTLVNWYLNHNLNRYDLVLMVNKIPTSKQVLQMQANKKRCVSLINDKLDALVLGERDPLSFLLHDLVHAYKMFSNPYLFNGQVGFCRAMLRLYADQTALAELQSLLEADEKFADAYDYLISDMNSHPKHLFFYFKAILINAFKFKHGLAENGMVLSGESLADFQRVFNLFIDLFQMNDQEKDVARRLFMYNTNNTTASSLRDIESEKLKQKLEANLFDRFFLDLANKSIN